MQHTPCTDVGAGAAQEAAGRGLSSMGAAGRRSGGFTGPSYYTSSPGVTFYILHPCAPKHILFTKVEGWGGG